MLSKIIPRYLYMLVVLIDLEETVAKTYFLSPNIMVFPLSSPNLMNLQVRPVLIFKLRSIKLVSEHQDFLILGLAT